MPLRLSRGVVMTTAFAALLAVPSAASAGAGFVRDLSIDPVTVACPKGGAEKGRVVIDVPVHYSDVTKDREDSVRGKKQRLDVIVQILSPDSGKVLVTARHSDKGKLALAFDRVDHVHRIVLSPKDSAIVQRYARSGAGCSGTSLKSVTLKTKATQTVAKSRSALRGLAAAVSQSANRTDEASVAATPKVGRVVNGCPIKPAAQCAGVDLTGQSLQGALLLGANLQNATLTNANLTSANLTEADLSLVTATGPKSVFTSATLTDAIISQANLVLATFTKVNALRANFASAQINGVDFTGATLDQSNISGTNLDGTVLNGASLADVSLAFSVVKNTKCDANTEVSGPPFYNCQNGILTVFQP